MTSPRIETLAEGVTLYCGDCLELMADLEPNSIDSCVTDPPYGLGFMGKAWDHGIPGVAYWKQVIRVLKPGGHLLSFGGTRTFGRMHVAIEDAGFEIRDMISWLYGSGFPKSLDVSKAIDKAAGAERNVVGRKADPRYQSPADSSSGSPMGNISPRVNGGVNYERAGFITAPATEPAREWSGFGTALKPACEPIVLARKPLSESTVAANVLKWGTGALNIDGCRVGVGDDRASGGGPGANRQSDGWGMTTGAMRPDGGRWPANVILSVPEDEYELKPFTSSEQKRELFRWLSENA